MTEQQSDCIVDIKCDIAEIKTDMRNMLERLNGIVPQHCVAHTEQITNVEKRIGDLEDSHRWNFRTSVAAIISALGSLAVFLITKYLGG